VIVTFRMRWRLHGSMYQRDSTNILHRISLLKPNSRGLLGFLLLLFGSIKLLQKCSKRVHLLFTACKLILVGK